VALTVRPEDVDAVLFDMGGVFVLPRPPMTAAALHRAGFADLAAAPDSAHHRAHYEAMRSHDLERPDDADIGRHYLSAYLTSLGVGSDGLDRVLGEVWSDWERPSDERWIWAQVDEVAAFAEIAADRPVGVVSNCDGTAEVILEQATICQVGPGAGVCVAVIVDSDVAGVAKPDPAIFSLALEALGTEPHRTVFVGDSRRFDVDGARAAGLHPVQLDPYELYEGEPHDRIRSLRDLARHLAEGGRPAQSGAAGAATPS
jgi:putative hydrolase of the HAD superfamily